MLALKQRWRVLSDDSLLFLSSKLTEVDGSSLFVKFFKNLNGLSITTTLLRKLIETEASDLHKRGRLSYPTICAGSRLIGHSRATAERDYIIPSEEATIEDRLLDADEGDRIMTAISGRNDRQTILVSIDIDDVSVSLSTVDLLLQRTYSNYCYYYCNRYYR